MKATGIVRRIDDLGRVVVPKEIRRTLRIREGDPLEIFTDKDGSVVLRKYSPIGELSEYVEEIDSDVSDLEEALFSEEDDDDEEDEEDDEEDEDDDEDGDGLIEYECPHCGTVIFFDENAFDMEEEHLCPNCHRKVFEEDGDDGDDEK